VVGDAEGVGVFGAEFGEEFTECACEVEVGADGGECGGVE
jgi:hypothetical protein